MGGNFSEGISFFSGILLVKGHNTNALQMVCIRLNNMLSNFLPRQALNLQIGQFIPDMSAYKFKHRSLIKAFYALNTYKPSNGSSLRLSHRNFCIMGQVIGGEASGLLTRRLRYVVGLSNGNALHGEDNKTKDLHGKIAYKFGGMAFDGSYTGEIFDESGNNWTEKSITVSGFAYSGSRLVDDDPDKDVSILRLGGDVNVFFRDLNVIGGVITGTDEDFYTPDGMAGKVRFDRGYNLFFVETSYLIYPWLVGVYRFEQVNPSDIHEGRSDQESFSSVSRNIIHASALYTANLKFYIETRFGGYSEDEKNLFLGMDFAF